MQLCQLVLRERLRRKQVEGARGWILQDGIQYWRVVTERLARSGWRDGDDVPPREDVLERFRLMGVELLDAAAGERGAKPVISALGIGRK